MSTLIVILISLGSVFGNVSANGDSSTNPSDTTPSIIIFDDRQQ